MVGEVISVVTALTIIVIILLSSGVRIFIRQRFKRKIQPHLDALERVSKKNAELQVSGK